MVADSVDSPEGHWLYSSHLICNHVQTKLAFSGKTMWSKDHLSEEEEPEFSKQAQEHPCLAFNSTSTRKKKFFHQTVGWWWRSKFELVNTFLYPGLLQMTHVHRVNSGALVSARQEFQTCNVWRWGDMSMNHVLEDRKLNTGIKIISPLLSCNIQSS